MISIKKLTAITNDCKLHTTNSQHSFQHRYKVLERIIHARIYKLIIIIIIIIIIVILTPIDPQMCGRPSPSQSR